MTISNLVAAYLFFGGAGAGTFFVAAMLKVGAAKKAHSVLRVPATAQAGHDTAANRGFVVSLVLLAAGVLCLMLDLGRPDLVILLFAYPTFSYITVGAYALALVLACALLLAVAPWVRSSLPYRVAGAAALVLGSVAALFAMTYTGLLLRTINVVPLWDSLFLPVLFVLSSLAAGLACIALCANLLDAHSHTRARLSHRFALVDVAVIALETITTAAYLGAVSDTALGSQAVSRLLQGDVSTLFIGGFVACGLAVPAVLDVISLRGCTKEWLAVAAAAATVVGCFCLRLALVQAGVHSTV